MNLVTLRSALYVASTDTSRPALCDPWVSHEALCATDSYSLLVMPGLGGRFDGRIPRAAIEMLASYKLRNPVEPYDRIEVLDDRVLVPTPPGSEPGTISYPRALGQMPDWHKLVDAGPATSESQPFGLNPVLLGNLAKALLGKAVHPALRLVSNERGPLGAYLVTRPSSSLKWGSLQEADEAFGLLMSVRVST